MGIIKGGQFWLEQFGNALGLNERGSSPEIQLAASLMAAEKEYDLRKPQHLLDFLADANIRLVRREYLLHLEKEKRLWPRRQEAEHETFQDEDGSVKTALVTLDEYKRCKNVNCGLIRSVSHCWEAKQHPDPFRFQARELLPKIVSGWVFVDFICLPQYFRTAEEQVFFKRAMANMHVLYAHRNVLNVVRLETLTDEEAKRFPPDFIDIYYEETGAQPGSGKFGPQPFHKLELNETPYHQRGWCEAEKQWMCTKDEIFAFAPMTPARFRERVERGHQNLPDGLVLKFTHRSDEEIVVRLQEKIFLQKAPRRRVMLTAELPESELLHLAESLPHFVNLEWLAFNNLEIPEAIAMALIAGLKPLRHLKEIDFTSSCKIEEKAAMVLANGLLECQFARELKVTVTNGPWPEKLANELSLLIGRVTRRSDDGHKVFTIQAVGWQCWPFRCLWRQLAKICS